MFIPTTSFLALLRDIDGKLAEKAKLKGCPHCGGKLDISNYPRKPRGLDGMEEHCDKRLSFCCRKEGCRKRLTPVSVRFLGRKIYLGIVILLTLCFGIGQGVPSAPIRSVRRWKDFFISVLNPKSIFWRTQVGFFPAGFDPQGSVALIQQHFSFNHPDPQSLWSHCLKFFSPLSI
jgi:hypothetical protein